MLPRFYVSAGIPVTEFDELGGFDELGIPRDERRTPRLAAITAPRFKVPFTETLAMPPAKVKAMIGENDK